MKRMRWKSLIITCLICLLPILPGVLVWSSLPDMVAIHFNINNEPDNFAPRWFAVFGLPCMMALLQVICCVINDFNSAKHGRRVKFERVTKSIIPAMSILLQSAIICYALGVNLDMRRIAVVIVSLVLIAIGNYLPKFDYIKNYDVDTEKARKINRFIGFETVVMGVLGLVTVFCPPTFSVIWLFMLIPYAVIAVLYGIKNGIKKRD